MHSFWGQELGALTWFILSRSGARNLHLILSHPVDLITSFISMPAISVRRPICTSHTNAYKSARHKFLYISTTPLYQLMKLNTSLTYYSLISLLNFKAIYKWVVKM